MMLMSRFRIYVDRHAVTASGGKCSFAVAQTSLVRQPILPLFVRFGLLLIILNYLLSSYPLPHELPPFLSYFPVQR